MQDIQYYSVCIVLYLFTIMEGEFTSC